MTEISNGVFQLEIPEALGPRITGLFFRGGENMFAHLPGKKLDYPGEGDFYLYGGHRLWRAPEVKALTYVPDNEPVEIERLDFGCLVAQHPEPQTGLRKSIRIQMDSYKPVVQVRHHLENGSRSEITIAPWAITMLAPGGVAILPQQAGPVDPGGVLPNRSLRLWPYSDIGSPNVEWGNRYIFLRAHMGPADSPFKVGYPNPRGWLGYWLDGVLFVKEAAFDPAADYPHGGNSSEVYFNDAFLELETLGPLQKLGPGDAVTHEETWRVFGDVPEPVDEEACDMIVARLALR